MLLVPGAEMQELGGIIGGSRSEQAGGCLALQCPQEDLDKELLH